MKLPFMHWLRVLFFGLKPPRKSRPNSAVLVRRYARGNVNLKRGRYTTREQVEQRRKQLS